MTSRPFGWAECRLGGMVRCKQEAVRNGPLRPAQHDPYQPLPTGRRRWIGGSFREGRPLHEPWLTTSDGPGIALVSGARRPVFRIGHRRDLALFLRPVPARTARVIVQGACSPWQLSPFREKHHLGCCELDFRTSLTRVEGSSHRRQVSVSVRVEATTKARGVRHRSGTSCHPLLEQMDWAT